MSNGFVATSGDLRSVPPWAKKEIASKASPTLIRILGKATFGVEVSRVIGTMFHNTPEEGRHGHPKRTQAAPDRRRYKRKIRHGTTSSIGRLWQHATLQEPRQLPLERLVKTHQARSESVVRLILAGQPQGKPNTRAQAWNRNIIHKIGATGGKVETRIANAEQDATYLLAKVEIAATYKLAGINRKKMENLFHRLFAPARLNITIHDRFGNPVHPREWFVVPLFVIDEAVARIKDGSIMDYAYDPEKAQLVQRSQT